MYHFPVDPPSSEQYQRQLSNFNNKPLEELLQQSDWPIGNLADRREPCRYGVARIDNVTCDPQLHTVLTTLLTCITDSVHRHSPGGGPAVWKICESDPPLSMPYPHRHGALHRQDYGLLC